jgi:hypothetical protein
MVSNFALAETLGGFPTEIQTTSSGVQFKLNCSPTNLAFVEEIKTLIYNVEQKLQDIQCDVKKMRNPLSRCKNSVSMTVQCGEMVKKIITLQSNHPNYLALLQLISTSYLSQNYVNLDLTLTSQSELVNSYDLNAVSLK